MPCHSLFLLTVALLGFQAKKLPFREQSLSIGETGAEGNELGYETIAFAMAGV